MSSRTDSRSSDTTEAVRNKFDVVIQRHESVAQSIDALHTKITSQRNMHMRRLECFVAITTEKLKHLKDATTDQLIEAANIALQELFEIQNQCKRQSGEFRHMSSDLHPDFYNEYVELADQAMGELADDEAKLDSLKNYNLYLTPALADFCASIDGPHNKPWFVRTSPLFPLDVEIFLEENTENGEIIVVAKAAFPEVRFSEILMASVNFVDAFGKKQSVNFKTVNVQKEQKIHHVFTPSTAPGEYTVWVQLYGVPVKNSPLKIQYPIGAKSEQMGNGGSEQNAVAATIDNGNHSAATTSPAQELLSIKKFMGTAFRGYSVPESESATSTPASYAESSDTFFATPSANEKIEEDKEDNDDVFMDASTPGSILFAKPTPRSSEKYMAAVARNYMGQRNRTTGNIGQAVASKKSFLATTVESTKF